MSGEWPAHCFLSGVGMRLFSQWIIALCASPAGVVILAALDSTVFLNLPLGIDAAIVILAARLQRSWWIVPLLASAGSIAGAALTFRMGITVGEKGLDRYVPPKRLERIRTRIRNSGAIALAVLDLIPPPFPFTGFVIAAGALEVKISTFFATLVVCRLLRFGIEAALAATYGKRIVAWLESDLFQDIAPFFIILAIGLTVWSTVHLLRSHRPQKRRAAAA
jgi:membrane protein YqaA with SNARE-associated domain